MVNDSLVVSMLSHYFHRSPRPVARKFMGNFSVWPGGLQDELVLAIVNLVRSSLCEGLRARLVPLQSRKSKEERQKGENGGLQR